MGPQLDSCGRAGQLRGGERCRKASMGPQLDSCGRGLGRVKLSRLLKASMGPQLDSCGRQGAVGDRAVSGASFNGAAT